jgi:hypothetical protein
MATFVKDKQTGSWQLFGTVEEIKLGQVKATRANGETSVCEVVAVSKPFTAKFGPLKGKDCCFGTLAAKAPKYDKHDEINGWKYNGCSKCRSLGDWCKSCAFDEFDD